MKDRIVTIEAHDALAGVDLKTGKPVEGAVRQVWNVPEEGSAVNLSALGERNIGRMVQAAAYFSEETEASIHDRISAGEEISWESPRPQPTDTYPR